MFLIKFSVDLFGLSVKIYDTVIIKAEELTI
jgi:hypothetical protein